MDLVGLALAEAAFEVGDELVALILDVVDLAAGAAFAFFGAADFFLELVLFSEGRGLAGLVAQGADFGVDADEVVLGGADFVVGPVVDLLGGEAEVAVVALDRLAEGGLAVTAGFGIEAPGVGAGDGSGRGLDAGAGEEFPGGLRVERGTGPSVVVEVGSEEEEIFGFVGLDGELVQAEVAGFSAQRLELGNAGRVGVEIEAEDGGRGVEGFAPFDDVFAERMAEPVKVSLPPKSPCPRFWPGSERVIRS